MDLAKPICRVLGPAAGLEAGVRELVAEQLSGTPCCKASEIAVAKLSIRPEMVEPSLAIVTKISPGWPFVEPDVDVAFVPGDGELVRERLAFVAQLPPHGRRRSAVLDR